MLASSVGNIDAKNSNFYSFGGDQQNNYVSYNLNSNTDPGELFNYVDIVVEYAVSICQYFFWTG